MAKRCKVWRVYFWNGPTSPREGTYECREDAEREAELIRAENMAGRSEHGRYSGDSLPRVDVFEERAIWFGGRWYEADADMEVRPSLSTIREQALAKLTIEERAALGVK